jgi:patatin-like phospholipase/acyl hydrolase
MSIKPIKYILTLGSGGVRGAIISSFLECMEAEMSDMDPIRYATRISDKFNMFAGISTGAFIASGFAHLQLSAKEITDHFYSQRNIDIIMHKTWTDYVFGLLQTKPKYSADGKRCIISQFAKNISFTKTDIPVYIPVYNITSNEAYHFKSWNFSEKLELADVLDAASSAPGFFPSVKINNLFWGIDGVVCESNASLNAYIYATELFPKSKIKVLSIGTGYGCEKSLTYANWGGIEWALNAETLLSASCKNNILTLDNITKSKGDDYLCVDCCLDPYIKMDDTTCLEKLKLVGVNMWSKNRAKVLEFLDLPNNSKFIRNVF